jgi:hypothetical protein
LDLLGLRHEDKAMTAPVISAGDLVERLKAAIRDRDESPWDYDEELTETYREAAARIEDLEAALAFVHHWTWYKEGNGTSDAERLSVIKHYPPIAAIARLNQDGGKP